MSDYLLCYSDHHCCWFYDLEAIAIAKIKQSKKFLELKREAWS